MISSDGDHTQPNPVTVISATKHEGNERKASPKSARDNFVPVTLFPRCKRRQSRRRDGSTTKGKESLLTGYSGVDWDENIENGSVTEKVLLEDGSSMD